MATLNEAADGRQMLLVKGAPEVILEHCSHQQLQSGEIVPIDLAYFSKASDQLAGQGRAGFGPCLVPTTRPGSTPAVCRRQIYRAISCC